MPSSFCAIHGEYSTTAGTCPECFKWKRPALPHGLGRSILCMTLRAHGVGYQETDDICIALPKTESVSKVIAADVTRTLEHPVLQEALKKYRDVFQAAMGYEMLFETYCSVPKDL